MPAAHEVRFVVMFDEYDAALRLFRDILGFDVRKELDEQGGRGVILELPEATLELVDREHGALVDEVEAGRPLDDRLRIAVNIDSLGPAAEHVSAAGALPMAEPVVTPWGDTNQRFRAADDLQLTLFESPPR